MKSKKYSKGEVYKYWKHQAMEFKDSYKASWTDLPMIELEIRELLKYIEDGNKVLDIGCANGFSTIRFALSKDIIIHGVDYIPEMIEQANLRLSKLSLPNVKFYVGDVSKLDYKDGCYDKVISTRVIISSLSWNTQLEILKECIRVLRPGGLFLLSEATIQGWINLNKFREEWGIAPVPVKLFNKYLDRDKVLEALSNRMELVKVVNFASTYYVGTRVFKPLLSKLRLGLNLDVSNTSTEINRWFAQLPQTGDYGIQELFVFRKR